jgi:hypothetical protein
LAWKTVATSTTTERPVRHSMPLERRSRLRCGTPDLTWELQNYERRCCMAQRNRASGLIVCIGCLFVGAGRWTKTTLAFWVPLFPDTGSFWSVQSINRRLYRDGLKYPTMR